MNANNCNCRWKDCAFSYQCINCENKFYKYLELKKNEEIRISNKNKSLGRCNCNFIMGVRIYECNNCYKDLRNWYHTPEYKISMDKIYKN